MELHKHFHGSTNLTIKQCNGDSNILILINCLSLVHSKSHHSNSNKLISYATAHNDWAKLTKIIYVCILLFLLLLL